MKKQTNEPSSEVPKARDNDGLHKRRGIWYYTLMVEGERRFFSTKTRNYQEARKVRSEAIATQSQNKLPNDLAKWPFEKLLAQVFEDRKPHLAATTARLEYDLSKPLLKRFSGRRVSEINPAAIRRYQSAREEKVSHRTVNLEVKLLRQVLKAAKVWDSIRDDYKRLPETKSSIGRAIEDDQAQLLFNTARSRTGWDAAFYAAMVAANTTMRSIEIKSLRLQHVDLIDREVSVQRSKGNTSGVRRIPLNEAAVWAFGRLVQRARALGATEPEHFLMPAFGFRTKAKATHGTGYDPDRHQKTWRTAWRALVQETATRAGRAAAKDAVESGGGWRSGLKAWRRAASVYRRLRFHDLRHLGVTRLAESGASDETVMAIAGHLSREMMEHYSHIRMAAKRKAVEAIPSYIPEEQPVMETPKDIQ